MKPQDNNPGNFLPPTTIQKINTMNLPSSYSANTVEYLVIERLNQVIDVLTSLTTPKEEELLPKCKCPYYNYDCPICYPPKEVDHQISSSKGNTSEKRNCDKEDRSEGHGGGGRPEERERENNLIPTMTSTSVFPQDVLTSPAFSKKLNVEYRSASTFASDSQGNHDWIEESWEDEFDKQFEWSSRHAGSSYNDEIKSFIRTTLANEKKRMIEEVKELKKKGAILEELNTYGIGYNDAVSDVLSIIQDSK